MTKWLSNKWNLIGIYALCSTLIGIILYNNNITFTELLIVYTLMTICSLVVYTLGIGRGMFLYALQKEDLDNFVRKLLKRNRDNKK